MDERPGRAVGPVDHSPGRNPGRRNPGRRNPGAQRHTPPNRAARPEWMYRPARIRPHRVPGPPRVSPWAMIRRPYRAHRVPGPPRVSPWAMIRRPYRAHGYPHQQTKRASGPEWMNARGRVFAPCRGARWGVCNTPLHGYPHQHLNGPPGPNGTYPERPVGPPDHSPGRNPGRRNPGAQPPTSQHLNGASGPNKPTSTGPQGPNTLQ